MYWHNERTDLICVIEFGNGLEERVNLFNVQETCAQLSLLNIVSGMKKEIIDPDGKGTGLEPIKVSF